MITRAVGKLTAQALAYQTICMCSLTLGNSEVNELCKNVSRTDSSQEAKKQSLQAFGAFRFVSCRAGKIPGHDIKQTLMVKLFCPLSVTSHHSSPWLSFLVVCHSSRPHGYCIPSTTVVVCIQK